PLLPLTPSQPPTRTQLFFFSRSGDPRHLHPFPTRRSSDLESSFSPASLASPTSKPSERKVSWAARLPSERPCHSRSSIESRAARSEEHTSELQSPYELVCRLLLEKKKHVYFNHDTDGCVLA